ncbi:hypothetical protein AAY473_012788 [Plecturocebus cupreus]
MAPQGQGRKEEAPGQLGELKGAHPLHRVWGDGRSKRQLRIPLPLWVGAEAERGQTLGAELQERRWPWESPPSHAVTFRKTSVDSARGHAPPSWNIWEAGI